MGVLTERIKGEIMLLKATSPRGARLASSINRVIGETVIQPIAMEVATVTAERGPKTDASNGRPTAAEWETRRSTRHGAVRGTQMLL